MTLVIETQQLVKRYGAVAAVDGISLQVAQGEIYAFLGLNGAGKTTTIRMLLGMVKPSVGQVRVLGLPIERRGPKPWAKVGYLVESPSTYPELTVWENLEAQRRLRPGIQPQAVDRVIQQLRLTAYRNRRAGVLSLGNAQRLGLAKALLHSPRLLILDEPANGLDPAGIVEIRALLLDLAHNQGVTIFMSSHILGEVSRLAQRIGIIHQGRLIQELDAAELNRQRRRRLTVRTQNIAAARALLANAGHTVTVADAATLELMDEPALTHPDEVAALLVHGGHPPTHLAVEQEALEPYFLRLVGMAGTDGE